jgi:hypothetical protein
MSYCRWSSDFFECDVYVYANVSGAWTTHVAGRRLKHRVPDELKAAHPLHGDPDYVRKYMDSYRAVECWRHSLPCDEHTVKYAQPDGTTKPGIWRTPKASEYVDLREIGQEAGQSYDDASPGECADRLEQLKAKGFNVPQYAIDGLREDQREIDQIDGDHGTGGVLSTEHGAKNG